MSNFITNSEGEGRLQERLSQLITHSEELRFLVGFFYFSGIRELYDSLKQNNDYQLKVLVGLNVDTLAADVIVEVEGRAGESQLKARNSFLKSVRKSLNNDNFDTEEFYKQITFFVELIEEGRLVIRKTREPNHAKLYIFKLAEGQMTREYFITGSSNLTKAGLTTQNEFNVEIKDYGYADAEGYFDDLWRDAVHITEDDRTNERLITLIKKETHIREVTPFEAYVAILKNYLDTFEEKKISQSLKERMVAANYVPYKYQLDAVKQALAVLDRYNGVIVADVVGLGKSVIAAMIAKETTKRGLIVCPPGLIGDKVEKTGWYQYVEDFDLFGWEVMSSGNLESVSTYVQKTAGLEVIIIDEAHRFRNAETSNYELLKNICRGKKVILLTATPFNNAPADILSLLSLFTVPKKSLLTLSDDLTGLFRIFKGEFRRLSEIKKHFQSSNPKKVKLALKNFNNEFGEERTVLSRDDMTAVEIRIGRLARRVRSIIEPVTIRRNRLDLKHSKAYQSEVGNLSKIDKPKEWFFELSEEQSAFYDKILKDYFADTEEGGRFTGAVYRPFEYESGKTDEEKMNLEENRQYQIQKNLSDFMRRLLVKRFESSFGSFRQSMKNFHRTTSTVLAFIENTDRYILDRKLIEKIYELDPDEIEDHLDEFAKVAEEDDSPNNRVYELEEFAEKESFLADIRSDILLFEEVLQKIDELKLTTNDPKAATIIQKIQEVISEAPKQGEPKQKVIIFTEYADTVKHLQPILEGAFPGRVLSIVGALHKTRIDEINRNFDASYKEQDNNYDILLATDKISEGFNLNRAGMVINYDIPWNPVRVIQRVGRINRISKKVFETLYIVNFFPSERGADLVKSREIASNKMFMIHSILGEDVRIFHADEEPSPAKLFNMLQDDPDEEEESFYTKVYNLFEEMKSKYPELVSSLAELPLRIKVAKTHQNKGLFVFVRKGHLYVKRAVPGEGKKTEIETVTLEEVFNDIKCDVEEKGLGLSGSFWNTYEETKAHKDTGKQATSEQSIEVKAHNMLRSLTGRDDLYEVESFIDTLIEDMDHYGTLPLNTLRKITLLEGVNAEKIVTTLVALSKELGGENYLEKEKRLIKETKKEIIIAVENQDHG